MKVIIIYDTKYGNTKQVAEKIAEGMRELEELELVVSNYKDIKINSLVDFEAILFGAPIHLGSPTRAIKKFIDKISKIPLRGKRFATFDTYLGDDFEKGVKKLEQKIIDKIPDFQRIIPGLSVKVEGMKGPVLEEEWPKCIEFGKKIADLIK